MNSASAVTLLAPSNAAFDKFLATKDGTAAAADPAAVAALLSYHALNGTVPGSAFTASPQFLNSLLTDAKYTNVTGGQVVEGVLVDKKVEIFTGLKEKSTVQTAVSSPSAPLSTSYIRAKRKNGRTQANETQNRTSPSPTASCTSSTTSSPSHSPQASQLSTPTSLPSPEP